MYLRASLLACISLTLMLTACQPSSSPPSLPIGRWHFELALQPGISLPFLADIQAEGSGYRMNILNGVERLAVDTVFMRGDSVFLQPAIFDSEFQGQLQADGSLQGRWVDRSRGADYQIPFTARPESETHSQAGNSSSEETISERYAVRFSPDSEDEYPAVGVFSQDGNEVSGTFLTETGDYRYLVGTLKGQSLQLSAFDGSHAFLFQGKVKGDSIQGMFFSGKHWEEPWVAVADSQAALRDPESLTFLQPGHETLAFTFPDESGNLVSLQDEAYQGKVVIVQLLGSWCPNCMDETRLFAEWHQQYQPEGLAIIGLAFERAGEPERAWHNLKRLKKALKVDYDLLLASNSPRKIDAAAALPMLNHVMSFPTSIFIDRQGRVRKIHTGFYGPGTAAPYLRFVEQYEAFLQELLAESAS